jgi:conjugal transfer pilus assembly protein TraK
MKTYNRILCAVACVIASIGTANALQVIDPVEGHNSFIKISAKELTRIAVENGKLVSLIASDGELVVEKDADRGQIFIRPLVLNKPINVRLITGAGGTYSVVMQAVDIPQEDVVIRDPAGKKGERSAGGEQKATSHSAALKALVAQMANPEQSSIADVKQMNQEVSLWENSKFFLTAVYTARGLVGEKYRLHNTGKERLRLVEQELFRKGVVAVAIENLNLDPGQSTNVYVIRGGR